MFTTHGARFVLGMTLVTVSGCVSVSRTDGARAVEKQLSSASPSAPPLAFGSDHAASEARVADLLTGPLTASAAVQIAVLRNPQILQAYARLGISQAGVVAASRIANPVISGSWITGSGERQSIGGIAQPLSDLLLLPARKRFAAGEYRRVQQIIAASLLDLVRDTEAAWYRYVSAEQVNAMRQAVARSTEVAAALATRFFDAGNISELDLALSRSAAGQARVASLRAAAAARGAKYDLHQRMGLAGTPQWQAVRDLPAPEAVEESADSLVAHAREQRPDLLAARQEIALLADAVGVARRWQWLGTVEVGVQRERETDGRVLTGPTLALALPIFSQGQAGIAKAEAELEASHARLAALETSAENAVRLGLERLVAAQQTAEAYRASLVPEHEVIVQRQQERQNFMFIGQFELLLAKQQQYDAYQGYIEAVSDYWVARTDLERAIGADLPRVSSAASAPPVGVDAILTPPAATMDHMHHGAHGESMPSHPPEHDQPDMSSMPGMSMPPPEPPPHDAIAPKGDRS